MLALIPMSSSLFVLAALLSSSGRVDAAPAHREDAVADDSAALMQAKLMPRRRAGEDASTELGTLAPAKKKPCASVDQDPWITGDHVFCCAGLEEQLGNWHGDGRYFYRCVKSIPEDYYPHFDTSADYLNIGSRVKGVGRNGGSLEDNYYLVIGDQGGCDGGCGDCCTMQRDVAAQMNEYVASRKRDNPNSNLLFVLAVGDNFYWVGAKEGRFSGTWKDVYSKEITDVPWFAVMGNHDYGNDDPKSGCPSVSPRFVCNSSNANTAACGGAKPYSTEVQGYDCNQLNSNKGGVDGEVRTNFHMPDYTYYYTIPQLSLELIALDWNIYDIDGLGGNGGNGGASLLWGHCGGYDRLRQSLSSIKEASTKILNERAAAAQSNNVAIFSHYPDEFQKNQNLRRMFEAGLPADAQARTKTYNFFGHTHVQQCDGYKDGGCVDFLTGGSGGCCSFNDKPAGFVAINFDNDKKQNVECFTPDPRCTLSNFPRDLNLTVKPKDIASDVCSHTRDDPSCPNFLAPGMGYLREKF